MVSSPHVKPRYELGAVILSDGAGTLHAAHDRHLGRDVDVKVLRGRHPTRERRRMEREARLLGVARHPGLPTLLDARIQGEEALLVYNRVSTRTLADEVAASRPTRRQALEWTRQIASALQAAHAQGIVHSDLRPDVVLVPDAERSLVVHGFGRARTSDATDEHSSFSEALDVPLYLAPEVLLDEPIDVRADVFGVIGLLRFLLIGAPPVDVSGARSPAEALERVLYGVRAPVEGVSIRLATLLDAGSAREPSRRPASMLEVLDVIASELGVRTDVPERTSDEPRLLPNQTVGSFRIRAELGRGGFGRVYLATDERLSRDVALKHFLDGRSKPELEGRALARVRHANVVRVYELFQHAGQTMLVHEHVPGESLDRRLAGGARPSPVVVGALLDQILAGLAAIHDAGIVHGDLKPANVVVDADWNAKLIDFGLATVDGEAAPKAGAITPAYCPPELASGSGARSPRSDLYSFGVLAFELATGRLPFELEHVTEMLLAHVRSTPPLVSSLVPSMAPFDALVAACLAKDPSARPASAAELRQRLARELRASILLRRPRRFLVVEDDPLVAEVLVAQLDPFLHGGAVAVAHDGESGLALAMGEPFDVVLLDLKLPRRSGVELLAELRAATTELPTVVVVSGEASSDDWRLLASMGARAILFKPVDPILFETTIHRFLGSDLAPSGPP
jgi:serine/threonine-protein kinase